MARITVGMPTYNAETHISEAIECILSQSFADLELIISDNASTDNTEEICRRYAAQDERVTYVRQDQNLGATENYNYVCRQSKSEYFKWQSSNDFCSESTLSECIEYLDEHSDVVLCYPRTMLFNESIADATDYADDMAVHSESPVERFLHVIDHMKLNNVMNGVVRLDALKTTPLIREFFFADRNMVADLALIGKISEIGSCVFYRRMDEQSATHLKSEAEVLAHFDPSWKRPLPFTNWRVFASFLGAVWSSRIGLSAKIKGSLSILRRAWWNRYRLVRDLLEFIRYLAHDLAQIFRK